MELPLTSDLVARRALDSSDEPFITEIGGSTLTYGRFHDLTLRWASVLSSLGVGPGDVVASWLPGASAYWTWFGAGLIGAVHVPVDPELPAHLLSRAVRTAGAGILVVERAQLARLDEIAGAVPRLATVIVVDAEGVPSSSGAIDIVAGAPLVERADPAPRPGPSPDAVALGLFTSGTTGASKCAQRTWEMLDLCGHWSFPADVAGAPAGGALYNPWPLFHSTGLTSIAIAAQRRLTLVLRRRFSLREFWGDVRRHRCSHVLLLVVAPLLLRRAPSPDDRDNPLRHVTICPLIRDFQEFERRFGVHVGTIYGQSETGIVFANPAPVDYRAVGFPVPEVEASIVGPDGRALALDQSGELIVRGRAGHRILTTYIDSEVAGAGAARPGGSAWLRTGDVFAVDPWQGFTFVDRMKDYIRHRGHNVSSTVVEDELASHPAVRECACVGVPSELSENDSVGDEDVKVVVVVRPGAQLRERDVVAFLAARLPAYMVPSVVEFAESLPRTPTGKVKKASLRRAAAVRVH